MARSNKNKYPILDGRITPTVIKMTIPSVVGMFGMMVFNIVDTYFVGQLGSLELAAISFTFPVVMVLNSLVFGIGTASMTLFSKAAGQNNFGKERILATSALTLGITISILMSVIGFITAESLFRAMGANNQLLPYVLQYMNIWFLGAGFMVIPMLGDSILRGLGDTFTPAFVMMTAAMANIVLDPLLIFGLGPFPEMGIRGAALATVISRGMTAVVSILIQVFREHLLIFKGLSFSSVWKSWKQLFHIGLPNSAVKAITPLGTAVFTSILARFGYQVVAGYGVATKLESIFLAFINAFSITATVFVGQNLGAGNKERTRSGIRTIELILFGLGLGIAVLFFFGGKFLGSLFNEDPLVQNATAAYLRIVPIGYGFLALIQISASILNVYHKPFLAGGLSLVQIGIIAIPSSFLLSVLLGANGVFVGILASFIISGMISVAVVRKFSKNYLK